ncbi:hypothetical protein Pen02_00250 [Plantactinospora endophytica]|uniref:Uncharacterized protein n=1 Tax=Plantactinospora endophytica TaxID=673535 RepID=A0ABQ4DRL3_9ACTN|nr:hypothetical protein Pen02_00250 [Plantactinospora endophytica]
MPVCTGKTYFALTLVVGGGVVGFFDGEPVGFALAVGEGGAVGVPSAPALAVGVSIGSNAGAPVGCLVSAQPATSAVTVTSSTATGYARRRSNRPGTADPPQRIRP